MIKDSELKYYKKKLRETEKELKIIGSFTMDSGYWINPEGKLVYQSPSIEIITGYKAEEIKRNHPDLFISLIHPDDLELFHSDFLENEGSGSKVPKVFRIINKKGETRWLETLSRKIFDDNGTYLGIRGSTRDITNKKLNDLKLKESEEKYRYISEVISDWAYSFRVFEDGTTEAEWVTDAYGKITGYTDEGKIQPELWFGIIYPEDKEIARKRQDRLTKEGKVSIDEYRIINSKGQISWIRDYGYPVLDTSGEKVIRVLGAAQDITRLKTTECKLKQSLKEKEILLKEIHHRIKNNLAMISGLIHMHLENISDNDVKNMLYQLENQIGSIGMIHEKLYRSEDLSTINIGDYIGELINTILESLSFKNVELKIDINNIMLNIDIALPLGLILNELTLNAIKHGFKKKEKNILKVEIQKDMINGMYILSFYNSGDVIPGSFNIKQPESLGMELVSLLAKQIGGNLHINDSDGFLVELTFPL